MRITVLLCIALLVQVPRLAAQSCALFPNGHEPAHWEKKGEVTPDDWSATFHPVIEGALFRQFQGAYEVESTVVPVPGASVQNCKWNWVKREANPGADTDPPFLPIELLPWLQILAQGPEDPNQPPPFMSPWPNDFDVASATLRTATGQVVPLQVTVVTDLTTLPTTVVHGERTWTLDWGPMSTYFTTLQGRYFLLSAAVPLSVFAPEGCPLAGCVDSGTDADLDGDCDVDLNDLVRLLAGFGTSSGATNARGDVNFDGRVDLIDLASLLARFGLTCHP